MQIRPQVFAVVLLLSVSLLLSCGDKKDKNSGTPANVVKDYPVLTLAPKTTTMHSDYPATIEGQQDIQIRPMIDGYLGSVHVDEGSMVKKGQLLFKINAPQYEEAVRTAQANIKIAQADVNAASMEVNKIRPLVQKNIISKYALESAEFTLQAKQGALAQSNAALANARTNLGYTSVTSPVNGVVGLIPYKIGSLVNANTAQPLTTVSNIGRVFAHFSINEKQLLDFSENTEGNNPKQRIATLPPVLFILANGVLYPKEGRIETSSGTINTETGSVRVRATFPNPDGIIRSGSSGSVRIPLTIDSAIVVPQKATYEIQGKLFVYLVDDKGAVKSQEIDVMQNSDGLSYVIQKGLKAGDRIVLEGVAGLREGAVIKPVAVKADSVYRPNT